MQVSVSTRPSPCHRIVTLIFTSRARDCAVCALRLDCLKKKRPSKEVKLPHDYPALLRARRRHARWSEAERRMYQRHLWRSEGFHGEAKNWHGLRRAVRRGLDNVKIQAYLTAAAVNLKRLCAALVAGLCAFWRAWVDWEAPFAPMAATNFMKTSGQPTSPESG